MISITIHIEGQPTEMEARILAAIAGERPTRAAEPAFTDAPAAEEPDAQVAEQPVKRTRRTKAEMEAARAATEKPTYVPDDSVTGSELLDEPETPVKETVHAVPNTTATLEDAVKLATDLVAANRVAELKEALNEMNAKRVSELKGDQIGVFLGKFAA